MHVIEILEESGVVEVLEEADFLEIELSSLGVVEVQTEETSVVEIVIAGPQGPPGEGGGEGGAHPDLAAHDTLGLATQTELNAVAAAKADAAHGHALGDLPVTLATDAEATAAAAAAVTTHEGAGNPHAGYATDADLTAHAGTAHAGDHPDADHATLATSASVTTAVTNHEGAGNPHPTYATDADLTTHAGTPHAGDHPDGDHATLATTASVGVAVDAHEAEVNPHAWSLPITFSKAGELEVTTGKHRWYADRDYDIGLVRASVGVAGTGATILVDIHKNGTTIFTTQASRPTVAASGFTDMSAAPDVTTIDEGEYFTCDVDQIGSTLPGEDLTVQVALAPR